MNESPSPLPLYSRALAVVRNKWIFLAPPAIAVIMLCASLFDRNYVIVPAQQPLRISAYGDSADRGRSRVQRFTIDSSGMFLQFELREGFPYPYAGIKIDLMRDSSFFDLSRYDRLSINISRSQEQDIVIHLRSFVKGFTRLDSILTHRFLTHEIYCLPGSEFYRLPLRTFTTPTWWYFRHRLDEKRLGRDNLKSIINLIIQNGSTTPINRPFWIKISYLAFEKNIPLRIWHCALFCGIYSLLCLGGVLLLKVIGKRRIPPAMVIAYQPLDVQNYADEELQRIASHLAANYSDPDLSLVTVARETGLLPSKISKLLKKQFHCGFKQYLNLVRIAESKRLLKETDRQIVDISRKVGYNNVTHFNRIFKRFEGITPNNYRKE